MGTYSEFSKGSEWRKWDLHIHTPESGMANKFGGDWDSYIKILYQTAVENEVAVLGITDYFTIDGYKRLKSEYLNNEGKLKAIFGNDDLLINKIKNIRIFPNIEFRLNTLVGSNRINYHIVFSDDVPINDIEENFLHDIEFVYEEEPFEEPNKSKLKRNNLTDLGIKLKREQPTFTGSDFSVGCTTAVVDDKQICKLLVTKRDKFKDKYIILIPVDEDLSTLGWQGQDHNVRKNYYQHTNAFFATNQSTIEFALGKKHRTKEEYLEEFKTFKPCLSGCDAHSCDNIKDWLGKQVAVAGVDKRITWIKADTTFDGLKQILCEPEGRVRIQATNPANKIAYNIIEKVKFIDNSVDKKFTDYEIGFNPDLNAIIGGKSSGKSLLLHSIAKAVGNRTDMKNYADILENVDLEVYYADSPDQKRTVEDRRIIEFLPQLFIEDIVRNKSLIDEGLNTNNFFNKFIEDLICQNLDVKELYGVHNNAIEGLQNEIDSSIKEWIALDRELSDTKNALKPLGDKTAISKEIVTLNKKIEQLTNQSGLTEVEQKLYTSLTESIAKNDNRINHFTAHKTELERLQEYVISEMSLSISNAVKFETNDDFTSRLFDTFKKHIEKSVQTEIRNFVKIFDEKLKKIEGINSILKNSISNYAARLAPLLEKNKIQSEIEQLKALVKIEQEKLANIEKKDKEIQALTNKRSMIDIVTFYRQIYESYASVVESINRTIGEKWIANDTNLTLVASSIFDEEKFVATLSSIINVRSYLENQFEGCGFQASEYKFDGNHITNISNILTHCISDTDRFNNFKANGNTKALLRSLFTNCWYIDFDIKRGNDSLQNMSEGKKGIVILQLYLSLSKSDCPILIDQPEDNLDNRTVYIELNDYIKQCKQRRQIIMVSHNANLVVNTDAENVIVANQQGEDDKENKTFKFEYVNGSLENTFTEDNESGILYQKGIREHVCEILEGGTDAFKKREEKYNLK